ncbi:unnamed protein product, partial [Anisakis simplex]|uniref:Uncharacterized protein n=1 Tax=Anisakis simplex TaxID=6269 RepID=A0A0M3JNY1_ANISI
MRICDLFWQFYPPLNAGFGDLAIRPVLGFETCPLDRHEYITDFECTGTDKKLVHESMLSFYSGHS